MKSVFLTITLLFCTLNLMAQYGALSHEDVIKMKDMTLVVKVDHYGERHKEKVKKHLITAGTFVKSGLLTMMKSGKH